MILFICQSDWANVGYNFAEALKSIGVEAVSLKLKKNSYENQSKVVSMGEMEYYASKAYFTVVMHSQDQVLGAAKACKKLAVFHGGSKYRYNTDKFNSIFNPVVDASFVQTGDLSGLGAKNEMILFPAIDTDLLQPEYYSHNRRIAHYPSNAHTKNSDMILNTIKKLSNNYDVDKGNVSWLENINRMNQCDIYVDAVMPELDGLVYGEWGVQALEAAALGKLVISHFHKVERYEEEYGKCPIWIANSERELELRLKIALSLPKFDYMQERRSMRDWVVKNHSYKATAERFMEYENTLYR